MTATTRSAQILALTNSPSHARRLVVVDAPDLIDSARTLASQVVATCDDVRQAVLLPPEIRMDATEEALAGADLVWLALPRSLAGLDEAAEQVAAQAAAHATLVVVGPHAALARSMNEVMARHFTTGWATRGVGKLRALVGQTPVRPASREWPKARRIPRIDLDVWAHGTTFAGGRLDPGTRALASWLNDVPRGDVLDFGCGSGVLAALLARRPGQPPGAVRAIDVLASSVDATRRTAESAGVDVRAAWADGLGGVASDSLDAIVTNPPFHRGSAKDSSATLAMFAEAARVLQPGGQLWAVYNSHLPWKARLSQLVGPTRLVAQDPRYTVVCATRR